MEVSMRGGAKGFRSILAAAIVLVNTVAVAYGTTGFNKEGQTLADGLESVKAMGYCNARDATVITLMKVLEDSGNNSVDWWTVRGCSDGNARLCIKNSYNIYACSSYVTTTLYPYFE